MKILKELISLHGKGKSTCSPEVSLVNHSASGVLTVMMHGDREDNPIPEMLPNAGTNPDNIITTISGIGNDGGDW